MNNPTFFIFILTAIFFVVFLLVFWIANRLKAKEAYSNKLKKIAGINTNRMPGDDIKLKAQKRAEIAKKLRDSSREEKDKQAKKNSIKMMLLQAGFSQTSVGRFWIYSVITAIVLFIILRVVGMPGLAVVLFSFVGLFGLPRFFLKWKIKRRQNRFLEDFADALDATVRLLRAGMPVAEAVAMCAREFEGPIGEEMSEIYENQKVGLSLAEAVYRSAERVPLTEMRMFATGVAIQSETGASLSEILTNLSRVIRARFRLRRKVQALSAEAKASAIIIGSLPLIVGFGMNAMNPGYTSILIETGIGKALLWGCAFWMGVGVLVMKQMINFKA